MAIKAIDLHTTKTVVHPDDKDNPTKWIIGAVDSRVYGQLSDRSLVVAVDPQRPDEEAGVKLAKNQLAFEVAQFGLKGWENFPGENGEPLPYATQSETVGSRVYKVAKGDLVARIPGKVLRWLHQQIVDMNKLDDEEGND
ncbi:hypothetical protein [Paracoccus sp. MKU1]|uniref:hypothetical protein n=1 Tax=Paracoccus sp. MKU1 TaxID=1745182 RepID=UPI0007192658|nr:hypothetical protein [Paracoccus sp. MKU1]KRW94357.1 hypothetical protein AQY21_20725 [Paracoccus sp. MKU1]